MHGCFGFGKKNKYKGNEEDMTVVYKIEALDENEAAFLPQDLPEVVLDTRHVTSNAPATAGGHRGSTLTNGRIKESRINGPVYSPQIQYMRTTPRKAPSTINKTTSVDTVQYHHHRRPRRPLVPTYVPVTTQRRYGSELGVGLQSYNHFDGLSRHQYVVPYQPVYVKPQAYHASLTRPRSKMTVYRQPSNAEVYTLSRPPGRAQPIRVVSPEQDQPITARNMEEVSATHLMEYSNHWNTYSDSRTRATEDLRASSAGEYVIEAPLEPLTYATPTPPKQTNKGRTHVRDIQYQANSDSATAGEVEISPVQPEGGSAAADSQWQDVSLYVRRPSLEDVNGVEPQHTFENSMPRVNHQQIDQRTTQRVQTQRIENTHRMQHQHYHTTQNYSQVHQHKSRNVGHSNGPKYVVRTTIPRDPPANKKSLPFMVVRDEAMQF